MATTKTIICKIMFCIFLCLPCLQGLAEFIPPTGRSIDILQIDDDVRFLREFTPTTTANHFYARSMRKPPYWAKGAKMRQSIGDFIFIKL